ncbi:hypothetical protein [Prosthecochloris sp. HL-130-GSB]|uniref:hypothetical protein n=1 Tax=Prosthecochloris sp. HL-130-GSB TaxID=1974213 RepID=UPI0018DB6FBF|nr:hypothetical protein [Prosthecochloris sp. HL-130-GSB]
MISERHAPRGGHWLAEFGPGEHRSPPFTIHHSPFTIHHSPFTIHHSPFTIHHSPFTIHHSPLTTHHSPHGRAIRRAKQINDSTNQQLHPPPCPLRT